MMFTATSKLNMSLQRRQLELKHRYFAATVWDLDKCVLQFSTNYTNPTQFLYIGELRDYILGYRFAYQESDIYALLIKFLEATLCVSNTRPRNVIGEVSTLKFSYASAWIHIWLSIFKNHTIVGETVDQEDLYFEILKCSGSKLLGSGLASGRHLIGYVTYLPTSPTR